MKNATLLLSVLTLLCLGGCGAGGKLALHSQSDRKLTAGGEFTQGVYRLDDRHGMTIVLLEGPAGNPTRAATVRLLWPPRNARTPLNRTATNATVRVVVFEGDEVGVYSGAGFVYPRGRPGQGTLRVTVEEADLRLTDATEGFVDRLGAARATGGFTVRRDDGGLHEALRVLTLRVTDALGYPQFVYAGDGSP